MHAEITNDHFTIYDGTKPVVHWVDDEWKEDPETVVPAMLNALHLMYTNPAELKSRLNLQKAKAKSLDRITRYYYSTRIVEAEDQEEAIQKVEAGEFVEMHELADRVLDKDHLLEALHDA